MAVDGNTLVEELRRLCKGRAMLQPNVVLRLGSQLRQAFDLHGNEPSHIARRKVRERVTGLLADDEPERQRSVALAALALMPGADHKLLGTRLEYLASDLNVAPRTVRRRFTEAIDHLADKLADADRVTNRGVRSRDDGFLVRRLRAVLHLDRGRPELHETRTIEVTTDRLTAIPGRFTLPRPVDGGPDGSGDLELRVVSGVTAAHVTPHGAEHFTFTLALPRTLALGDTFEYGVVFTVPAGRAMRPHFVFQPLVPCDQCELAVYFDPARPAPAALVDRR